MRANEILQTKGDWVLRRHSHSAAILLLYHDHKQKKKGLPRKRDGRCTMCQEVCPTGMLENFMLLTMQWEDCNELAREWFSSILRLRKPLR
jgi:formate hydrogenlyase subunit 6/NADH:ubiquinone oxidoreductase subunit I